MKKLLCALIISQGLSAGQAAQNLHRYMMGVYHQAGNNLKQAAHWYGQIVPSSDSTYVYLGYIPFLAATQSFQQIVDLIPTLDATFKSNIELQIIFATALEHVGKKSEAHARLVQLNDQNKAHQEVAFLVARMYLESAEPENALKVIDNFLNTTARRPNNYIFHFMKSQIYLQLNKKSEALVAIKQSIETYPKFDKSWLLYAVLQEQEGKIEEAIKGYTTFLETTGQANAEIERHLLGLAFRQKLANKTHVADSKQCLAHAIHLFEQKEYSKAMDNIDRCLATKADDVETRLMKIQVLVGQAKFDDAASLLGRWMQEGSDDQLWLETLHLCCYLGMPYKKATHTVQSVQKQKGDSLQRLLYQADFALRANNQAQAIEALNKAYSLCTDVQTKLKIALQLSLIYYDQEKWQLAQKTLEQAQALGAHYAPLDNLLAYLYARKNNDYARAMNLIEKALHTDPNNPHFLDTQAYIFYKQQDYDKALALFQKGAQLAPTDFTLLCHLGKCYYKKGDTTKAIQSIKSAIQVAKNDHDKKKAAALFTQWNKKEN